LIYEGLEEISETTKLIKGKNYVKWAGDKEVTFHLLTIDRRFVIYIIEWINKDYSDKLADEAEWAAETK